MSLSPSDRKILISLFRSFHRKLKSTLPQSNAQSQSQHIQTLSLFPPQFQDLYVSATRAKRRFGGIEQEEVPQVPHMQDLSNVLKSAFRDPMKYPQIVSGVVNSATRDAKVSGAPMTNIREEVFEPATDDTTEASPKKTLSKGIEAETSNTANLQIKPQYAIAYAFETLKEWNEWIAAQKMQEKSIQHSVCECWNGRITVTMQSQKPMRVTGAHLGNVRITAGQPQLFFPYTVRIRNETDRMVQVLSRFWRISFDNGQANLVEGLGVTGEQPVIRPGAEYEYSSYVPGTHSGSIEGFLNFQEISPEKEEWEKLKMTILPVRFLLTQPEKLQQHGVKRVVSFGNEESGLGGGSGSNSGGEL